MAEQNQKAGRTSALLRKLFNTRNLEKFIERNAAVMEIPAFHAYISELCSDRGQVPEQVIKRAGIERTYGHQLFNGTRKPSRDKVIQLAFGLDLDLDGAQKLLKIAQKSPLYPKIKRDAAIIYCLQHGKDILDTQAVLHELGLTLLGGESS
ncbi:MAG TPA: hypothetical protein VHO48_02550 [Anaerolineaceae bacterium]|nr:hypothetical protein [Anaerolineaceae bacterium]